ncbi:hypothetical protein OIU78_028172 [Salix suchowensis]|nr:hypothetical protein OIU78_028172 [Salix suchowensis]
MTAGWLQKLQGGAKLSRYAAEATAEHVGQAARQLGLKSFVMRVNGFTYFKRKEASHNELCRRLCKLTQSLPAKAMKNLKRGGFACVFVIVSICFSIYTPGFPPFQGSFQAYAQEAGFFGEVFHVPEAFDPDYEVMERKFKIFVSPLPHSHFLSFIACWEIEDERAIAVEDFVKSLISKYPYWNRTLGADHFFVTCADITYAHPDRFDEILNVPEAFGPDYEEMERNFKIFVYPHNITVCDDEYANEGLFHLNLDQTHFWTDDPEKGQLFLVPI